MHPRNKLNKNESRKIYLEELLELRNRTLSEAITEKMSMSNKYGSTSTRERSEEKATMQGVYIVALDQIGRPPLSRIND